MFSVHYIKVFLFFSAGIICSCNNPQPQPFAAGDTINEQNNMPSSAKPGITPGNERLPPPQPNIIKEIDGTVINYAANKDGDIDKFIINANNDNLVFHFPPHTAKLLLDIAAKNSVVHVLYTDSHKPPKHEDDKLQFELISIQCKANNKQLNVHDIAPPPPETGKEVSISSNKIQWQNNDAQKSNLIVSGKLIALPPHAKQSLMPLIKNAHSIVIKGYERSAAIGFVNMSGLTLVRPYAITIDGVNYLIR